MKPVATSVSVWSLPPNTPARKLEICGENPRLSWFRSHSWNQWIILFLNVEFYGEITTSRDKSVDTSEQNKRFRSKKHPSVEKKDSQPSPLPSNVDAPFVDTVWSLPHWKRWRGTKCEKWRLIQGFNETLRRINQICFRESQLLLYIIVGLRIVYGSCPQAEVQLYFNCRTLWLPEVISIITIMLHQ